MPLTYKSLFDALVRLYPGRTTAEYNRAAQTVWADVEAEPVDDIDRLFLGGREDDGSVSDEEVAIERYFVRQRAAKLKAEGS